MFFFLLIGSLELSYIDKNPNQSLSCVGLFCKSSGSHSQGGVRRIRSTALETCCPPPALTLHPNSLEIIGGKGTKNPLPPPSSSLIRNQHLNLCPYFGSEIVYPIAEQSDEHQTSHGPDTDLDSLNRNSDSDYEENQGSRSPLLFHLELENGEIIRLPSKEVLRIDETWQPRKRYKRNDERTSATSKDALLDNDNSNSSATPEMQDARSDFFESGDAKLCQCANSSYSNTSVECEDILDRVEVRRSKDKRSGRLAAGSDLVEGEACSVVKRTGKKNRKRKSSGSVKSMEAGNCSSLVELDLDWLFDDENERPQNRRGKHPNFLLAKWMVK